MVLIYETPVKSGRFGFMKHPLSRGGPDLRMSRPPPLSQRTERGKKDNFLRSLEQEIYSTVSLPEAEFLVTPILLGV